MSRSYKKNSDFWKSNKTRKELKERRKREEKRRDKRAELLREPE